MASRLRREHFDRAALAQTEFWCDAVKRSSDPTGTIDIRKRFRQLVEMRWRKVRTALQAQVVAADVLGLKPTTVSPFTGNKAAGFQEWFDALVQRIVTEDGAFMRPMIQASYNRAIKRAMRLTRTDVVPRDQTETVNALFALCRTELQGIAEAVSQRVMRAATEGWLHNESARDVFMIMDAALRKVGMTRSDAMVELMVVKAFSIATLDQFEAAGVKLVGLISETLPRALIARRKRSRIGDAKGLFGGPGSRISREVVPSASTIRRIRGVASKLEEAFGAEGPEEQDPNVAVQTAGDEDVCQECEDIEDGNPYTLDEARSLIPAHPRCRCAFVPDEEDGFFATVFGAVKGFVGKLFGDELDYNHNHDPKTGEFSEGEGIAVSGPDASAAVVRGGVAMVPEAFARASGVKEIGAYNTGAAMAKDFPNLAAVTASGNVEWVAGVYNHKLGKLGINVGNLGDKERAAKTIAHEMAHAYDRKNGELSLKNAFYNAYKKDLDGASAEDRSKYAHYYQNPSEAFAEGSAQLITQKVTARNYASLPQYEKAFPRSVANLRTHYTKKGLL